MSGVGMNFMTVSTMLSSSSSSPQPVGTAFFGRVRLPSEACSIAAAASASFSSFFLMPYYTEKEKKKNGQRYYSPRPDGWMKGSEAEWCQGETAAEQDLFEIIPTNEPGHFRLHWDILAPEVDIFKVFSVAFAATKWGIFGNS